MGNRILTLIRKELMQAIRDPKTRISLLVPPLLQLLVFAFAMTLDVKNVPIGILNRDSGRQGFELVQRFRGAPTFEKVYQLQAVEEIAPFIDMQKGVMVISLDEQFSRDLEAGRSAPVQLILDGRKSNTAQILAGYATTIIQRFNDEFTENARIKQQNVRLVSYNWFNPNLLYVWFTIPSLVATLSMLTCLIVTTNSIAREKELGTFDQLLVSPLSPFEILVGKVVPGVIVGMFEGLLLMAVGVLLFHVPFVGCFPLLFLGLLIFILAVGGIGLFISSAASTQQQAMLGTFVIMVPSVLLSGFATPIENMPVWLQPVTYAIPLRYILFISRGVFLKDIPASVALNQVWPLAIIACINLIGAGLLFRRKLQ